MSGLGTGIVSVSRETHGALVRLCIAWEADSDGVARKFLGPLVGTLVRFVSTSDVSHTVTIEDEYGADVLDGLGATITTTEKPILASLGARGQRPIVVAGEHDLVVSATNGDTGIFELWYTPSFAPRFNHEGLER